jgi:DNA-binding NtrC family response regulator
MEATKPRILCLDDQPEMLWAHKLLLEEFGCEVATASESSACLRLVEQASFDLVLLDYRLAEKVTGEDVARDIAALFPELPLVMFTGESTLPQSARECVDEVLIKGAGGPRRLLDTIQRFVPRSRIKPQRASILPMPVSADRLTAP